MDDEASNQRRALVQRRAVEFLEVVDLDALRVWADEADENTYFVEYLDGGDRWAYPYLSPGTFLPDTWTDPWDEVTLGVHFDVDLRGHPVYP